MAVEHPELPPAWTVAEAKARLSEILRLAEEEGPQRIGRRKSFVVVPARLWQEREESESVPLGLWLVENMTRGMDIQPPDRSSDTPRPPFWSDWTDEDWRMTDR